MLTLKLTSKIDPSMTYELELEHSLVSLSKWEQENEKPFFGLDEKTPEEMLDYWRKMVIGPLPKEDFVGLLTEEQAASISNYINAKRSGTTFRETPGQRGGPQIVTHEQMYSWLVSFRIPFYPVEHWHISNMMNLVRAMSIQQTKQKPVSHAQRMEDQRAINAERRARMGSSG